MKNKIILTLLAAIIFQTAWSQKTTIIKYESEEVGADRDTTVVDSSTIYSHADTIKIGKITIIQCEDCNTDKKKVTSVLFNADDDDDKELDNVEFSWLGFDIGINSYVDKSNYGSSEVNDFVLLRGGKEATEEFFSLRTIKSVNVNIWPVWMKINLIRHVLNIKTGIGIVMNNYRYTKDLIYVNDPNSTHIELSDIHFKKDKLFTEYLTIPILLHVNSNPYHDSRAFHFSAGPTFGLLIKSRTKQKSDKEGKVKNNDPFNLEKFRLGMRAELGYGPITFYGAYSFTPIHQYGLEQYPFSIGIILIGSGG